MPKQHAFPIARDDDRIDVSSDYAVCAWARYFHTSQNDVVHAVQAVGDRAGAVRDHLQRHPRTEPREHPSA